MDIYDALKSAVEAVGGPKVVGVRLMELRAKRDRNGIAKTDSMKEPEEAMRWVNRCLNRRRLEKFPPEDIVEIGRMAREADHYALAEFICDEWDFKRPEPKEPEEDVNEMRKEFKQFGDALLGLLGKCEDRLNKIQLRRSKRR